MNAFKRRLPLLVTVFGLAVFPAARPDASIPPRAEDTRDDRRALEDLLPRENVPETCECTSTPQFFSRGNLWDYINGAADTYLQYGFRLLLVSDWSATKDSTRLAVEIYRMESPRHAFGIYSAERFGDETPVPIGAEGYRGGYFLNFWKGPYYVKLSSVRSSGAAGEALEDLARAVSASIQGDLSPLELFEAFPREGRVERSERFVPNNFLGHAFLRNGHRVDYGGDDDRYQVFLADLGSRRSAGEAFDKYREFLDSAGYTLSERRGKGYRSLAAAGAGEQRVFQYEAYLGGVLDLGDARQAEMIVTGMIDRLREADSREKENGQ